MLKYLQVHVCNTRGSMDFSDLGTMAMEYTTETIVVSKSIQDDVYTLYNKFYCNRGYAPGTLVLGWHTWIQLSYAESRFENPSARISSWRDVPVVVDDSTPHWLQFLPEINNVRMGGYDFD